MLRWTWKTGSSEGFKICKCFWFYKFWEPWSRSVSPRGGLGPQGWTDRVQVRFPNPQPGGLFTVASFIWGRVWLLKNTLMLRRKWKIVCGAEASVYAVRTLSNPQRQWDPENHQWAGDWENTESKRCTALWAGGNPRTLQFVGFTMCKGDFTSFSCVNREYTKENKEAYWSEDSWEFCVICSSLPSVAPERRLWVKIPTDYQPQLHTGWRPSAKHREFSCSFPCLNGSYAPLLGSQCWGKPAFLTFQGLLNKGRKRQAPGWKTSAVSITHFLPLGIEVILGFTSGWGLGVGLKIRKVFWPHHPPFTIFTGRKGWGKSGK